MPMSPIPNAPPPRVRRGAILQTRSTTIRFITSADKKKAEAEEKENAAKSESKASGLDGGGDRVGAGTRQSNASSTEEETKVEGLEGQLTNEKLKQLECIFEDADEDGGGGLDQEEFRNAMRQAISQSLTDHELDIMFMKVDTNCDGTVDWDEYLSYMLLEYREKDQMNFLNKEKPFPNRLRLVPNMNRFQRHHDCIVRILYMPPLVKVSNSVYRPSEEGVGRYITITKEGVLNFWTLDLQHTRRSELETSRRNTWVTAMVVLPNANMCAVATTSANITFYDFAAGGFNKVLQIADLEICATCMDYWFDPKEFHHALLLWGDARGNIYILEFYDCPHMCALHPEMSRLSRTRVPLSDMLRGTMCGVRVFKLPSIHGDFVHDVRYCPTLESFMSCCRERDTALFVGDFEQRRKAYFRVRKGVFTFDYSKSNNIIVTGGKDALVRVWNPYVPVKPVMMLQGHKSAVVSVLVNEVKEQVISISETKDILIFDLASQTCIQNVSKKWVCIGPRPVSGVYFHSPRQALLIATNQLAILEHKEEDLRTQQLTSHAKPISHAIYNPLFEQVVSGGVDSLVCVWNVTTGVREMQFAAHRKNVDGREIDVEITAMQFDPTLRRLITAARDGCVKIWNFNNGALLRQLETFDSHEVTGLVCPALRIITAGWNKRLTVYVDTADDESVVPWDIQHQDDILSLAFYPPGTVASASYDGDILVWSLETGRVTMRFNANEGVLPFTTMQRTKSNSSVASVSHFKDNPSWTSVLEQDSDIMIQDIQVPITGTDCLSRQKLSVISATSDNKASADIGQSKQSVDRGFQSALGDHKGRERNGIAVEKLLFLTGRQPHKMTATLMASDGLGWVRAWSCHHEGGLLGQFNAAHKRGEAVLSMVSDEGNEYLITGDSQGYCKVWDLNNYCIYRSREQRSEKRYRNRIERYKKFPFLSIEPALRRRIRDQRRHKAPPDKSHPTTTVQVPPLLNSFRAHLQTITTLDFISSKELILTGSSDCSIRLWTLSGQYIGIFGQQVPWQNSEGSATMPDTNDVEIPQMVEQVQEKTLPPDVRRVASATTLKVFYGGSRPLWKLAKNIIMVWVPMLLQHKKHKEEMEREYQARVQSPGKAQCKTEQQARPVRPQPEQVEQREPSPDIDSLDMPVMPPRKARSEDVIGKSFKSGRKHQTMPNIVKPRYFQNQVSVFSSLPCYDLAHVNTDVTPPQTILEIQERNRSMANNRPRATRLKSITSSGNNLTDEHPISRRSRLSKVSLPGSVSALNIRKGLGDGRKSIAHMHEKGGLLPQISQHMYMTYKPAQA